MIAWQRLIIFLSKNYEILIKIAFFVLPYRLLSP